MKNNFLMKQVLFVFTSLFIFSSCSKKTAETDTVPLSLNAKWIVTQTLMDPGNGSGKWMPVSTPNHYYLQLNSDSTAQSNYFKSFTENVDLKEYRMANDSNIIFIFKDGSTRTYYCQFDNKSLTIMGGCYEACGSRFTRSR